MITRRFLVALAMLVAVLALLVTSAFAIPATGAPKGGTLRISTPADLDYVDPALGYYPKSFMLGYATCAKLFNYPDAQGAEGTKVTREVVRSYAVSTDRRTYTFDLHRTFRFHTGAPVTAQSFADAFNRDANPKLRSPATDFMREIAGAQDVIDGKATSISGVRLLGRYRLRIRLTKPVGDFLARLTLPFFCPVPPDTATDPRGIDDPAGSGPYYVYERIVNQRIVLKRNPYYRGNRPANVDQVIWTIDPPADCLLAAEQDRIDYCRFLLPETSYRPLAEKYGINKPGGQFFVSPAITTSYIAFNRSRPAFKGPGQIPLKKAINYAIDRKELTRAGGYLAGKRSDQMLPPALARATRIYSLEGADPATAREWLARAKRPPPKLVLYAFNDASDVAQAKILVFNLKQIDIDVEVKYFDFKTLPGKIATPGEPFDLFLGGWLADWADPATFFALLDRGNGVNLDDARINARVDAANRLTGPARRKAWADLDVDLMRTNPPWAPFMHTQARTFVSRSLGCFVHNPHYGFDIAAACKK
jgi:ABC-type oligopeptide transport system substrate-binding subunit